MTNESTRPRSAEHRLIAVGVGTGASGSAALRWAADEAGPGDELHIMHAYVPLSLSGSSWAPVVEANDARQASARWLVARAVTAVQSTHPQIKVSGSAIEAAPLVALADMSQIVDLVVVGADALSSSGTAPAALGRFLAEQSSCPVVFVPNGTDPDQPDRSATPVALLLAGTALPHHAVEFAFEAAARRHVTLAVCESCTPGPIGLPVTDDDISRWETTRQETLDIDLSPWQDKYRAAGVMVELRREGVAATAALLHRTSQLLVVARMRPAGAPLDTLIRTALHHASCPVAIVPDSEVTMPTSIASPRAESPARTR